MQKEQVTQKANGKDAQDCDTSPGGLHAYLNSLRGTLVKEIRREAWPSSKRSFLPRGVKSSLLSSTGLPSRIDTARWQKQTLRPYAGAKLFAADTPVRRGRAKVHPWVGLCRIPELRGYDQSPSKVYYWALQFVQCGRNTYGLPIHLDTHVIELEEACSLWKSVFCVRNRQSPAFVIFEILKATMAQSKRVIWVW